MVTHHSAAPRPTMRTEVILPQIEWRSEDGRFAARAERATIDGILEDCRSSENRETGGILVGSYTPDHNCAIIAGASATPPDSRSGATWFYRGVHGLRALLRHLWHQPRREYYLGEWHFHPSGPAVLSSQDRQQIRLNARRLSYRCPEPLIMVVGGEAEGVSSVRLYVCVRGDAVIQLHLAGGGDNG
jgi:proteasome lid subunit RPN8/RPN11